MRERARKRENDEHQGGRTVLLHESRNESIKSGEKRSQAFPHQPGQRYRQVSWVRRREPTRHLLDPKRSLGPIKPPETHQSTYQLQSFKTCHSKSFFIDCRSTLITCLIKTKSVWMSSVRHMMNETAHQPHSTHSPCLVFIIITAAGTPSVHISCISSSHHGTDVKRNLCSLCCFSFQFDSGGKLRVCYLSLKI